MKLSFFLIAFISFTCTLYAQSITASFSKSESLPDKHKFSRIIAMENDQEGGVVIIRAYYGGFILKLKGYYLEHYNKDLELINEYTYEAPDAEVMGVITAGNYSTIIEVLYDTEQEHYMYRAQRIDLKNFDLQTKTLFSFKRAQEKSINFLTNYSVPFNDKLYSQLLKDSSGSYFAIAVDSKETGKDTHQVWFFDADLHVLQQYDLKNETKTRHFVFENFESDASGKTFYLLGKAYEKGKRTRSVSLKYRYELLKITENEDAVRQYFEKEDGYPSSLKMIITGNTLKAVGFYSNTSDRKYRGLVYLELDPKTLAIREQVFNPFSKQFMEDKYGAETDKELKNLAFRGIYHTEEGDIVFNAEEEYVTSRFKHTSSDNRVQVNQYHYNDIVCARLNASGKMEWARNINKAEITLGDEAFVSYLSAVQGGQAFFFINSGAEPQRISGERILFKKGYSKNPEMFILNIDKKGTLSYAKVTSKQEVRLPIMVSKGVVCKDGANAFFLARRGSRKQLIKVHFETVN
ncbi:hypothetical protein [Ascidiimonas aurantiaca]|uniref:hypothetical protein n=1 Tax=Ascidiimonas aurantiaca TaxID=1685432 RepID=UPI0030EE7CCF